MRAGGNCDSINDVCELRGELHLGHPRLLGEGRVDDAIGIDGVDTHDSGRSALQEVVT